MLFTSIVFLLYFLPLVLLLYYALAGSRVLQNSLLFLASLFFYAWGEPVYVLLMVISILANTLFGYLVDRFRESGRIAKMMTALACFFNLGILFYYKYMGFVLLNLSSFLGNPVEIVKTVLPLGISFFTFQAISYVIDVYRGTAKVEKNPFYVGLYIAFFPQLIAGPIVRYSSIALQIRRRRSSFTKFSVGCCRFITGFGKKLLLANSFAAVADRIFYISADSPSGMPVTLAWLGIAAYTLQLFFDFAAYSDMAIGLGLLFGFEIEENFNYPLVSKSIGEFWRRWHISLSSWFREYVYFPLGGSRVSNKDKMVRNLFIVWLLTGIWHGAEWTFLLWGIFNFVFLLGERLFKFESSRIPAFLKHGYLLFVVMMGFVLFRAENLNLALSYYRNLFGLSSGGFFSSMTLMFLREYGLFFAAGIVFATPVAPRINKLLYERKLPLRACVEFLYPAVLCGLFLICLCYLVKGGYNPFIYFNF